MWTLHGFKLIWAQIYHWPLPVSSTCFHCTWTQGNAKCLRTRHRKWAGLALGSSEFSGSESESKLHSHENASGSTSSPGPLKKQFYPVVSLFSKRSWRPTAPDTCQLSLPPCALPALTLLELEHNNTSQTCAGLFWLLFINTLMCWTRDSAGYTVLNNTSMLPVFMELNFNEGDWHWGSKSSPIPNKNHSSPFFLLFESQSAKKAYSWHSWCPAFSPKAFPCLAAL